VKLHERRPVEGTSPTIYIGHRQYKDKNGSIKVSKQWFCEFTHQGVKRSEPLKTTNLKAATQAVWKIVHRLEQGEEHHVRKRADWDQLVRSYIALKRNQNRAPKTIEKYEYVLGQLARFGQSVGRQTPSLFKSND
jgi:hypothetical protein